MRRFDYVVIGGGMAADAAIRAIRQRDPAGSVLLASAERFPPYRRPYLSKQLWHGKRLEDAFWPGSTELQVEERYGTEIVALDPPNHLIEDADGNRYGYGKCLLATGARAKTLPFGQGRIHYLRSLDDYLSIRRAVAAGKRVAVIGGGFVGAEMAAALTDQGCQVTLLFPEEAILARIVPGDLASFLNDYFRQKGVEVLTGETPVDVTAEGDQRVVRMASGAERSVDLVVAGVGAQPNTELAAAAGLALADGGVLVDEALRTSAEDVYAAGDVATFFSPPLNRRLRVEHEQNARSQGRAAGANMAGGRETYEPLPLVYSDLFDLGFEAVGRLEARLECFTDWEEPYRRGVIYYLEDGRVVGVLNWNVWDAIGQARELIREGKRLSDPSELKGRIRGS